MSSKKHTRYKLLLDEGLPRREKFPQLTNLHNVVHVTHDFGKSGLKDPEVYALAKREERMVVVFNTKDFRPMVAPGKPTVITLSSGLTNKRIDQKLCKALKELKPSQKLGHVVTITNEMIVVTPRKAGENK